MCGFSGFIDYNNLSDINQLNRMNDVIRHRGPDAAGDFFDNKDKYTIGFGHRRLSIIDLNENANQPMYFNDLVIVFNGEIYNHSEIKKELSLKGRKFQTQSDTEVILQAYDEWGEACVHQFIGMFAFLILNKETQEVIIFRDRPGVKPFNYYWDGQLFLFGSEIKTFHKHPQFKKEINLDAVVQFMQYGYVPSPKSIFKNVQKLEPGSILKFDLKTKSFINQKYWNIDSFYEKEKLSIEFVDAKAQTEALIKSACDYRMVSDVSVGVFLSGGYDSTLVTALLQSNSTQKIKTFTIGVEDQHLNEASFAKDIAKHLETDHTELYCSEKEMFELIEKLPFHFDEPFGDSSAIPTMLVSKLAKKDVTVALSADGGDEVFAGYNRYDYISKLKKIQTLSKIPLPYNTLTDLFIKNKVEAQRFKNLLKNPSSINLADILNSGFQINGLKKLFKYDFSKDIFSKNEYDNNKIDGDLSQMMAYDYKTYLLDDILVKVDRSTMSASLEGREPLLDHRIIEYAAQLPDKYKYNKGKKKYILKEITHKYVPKEMMERPKMGFGVPVFNWLHGPLREKIEYYFDEEFIQKQSIFNFEEVDKMRYDILNKIDKHYQKLWYLLMFQMWYEKWMINES